MLVFRFQDNSIINEHRIDLILRGLYFRHGLRIEPIGQNVDDCGKGKLERKIVVLSLSLTGEQIKEIESEVCVLSGHRLCPRVGDRHAN